MVTWRDERTAEALTWLGDEAVAARTAALVALDDARGVSLQALDHRGGTTVWARWTEHELTPEQLAARAEHDRRTIRYDLGLYAQRPGEPAPGTELRAPGVLPSAHLCGVDISPDGTTVVWRSRPYERVPPKRQRYPVCASWHLDLADGTPTYLGPLRGELRYDPGDADTLWVMRTDPRGRRAHLEDLDPTTGTVTPRGSHRGRVFRSRLPDGTEFRWRRKGPRSRIDWADAGRLPLPRRRIRWAGWHDGRLLLRHTTRDDRVHIVSVDPHHARRRHWEELAVDEDGARFGSAAAHSGALLLGIDRDGRLTWEERDLATGAVRTPLGEEGFQGIWAGRTLEPTTLVRAQQPQGRRVWLRDADGAYTELEGPRYADHVRFETVYGTAEEGTEVPVSLQRPHELTGPAPLWVHVYGGFGHGTRAHGGLATERFVAAGGIVATVHARGGDERGEEWHDAARKRDLAVTYDDVLTAIHSLVDRGMVEPGRVVISGSSNGGLTAVATMLREPELFAGVIATAGVFDLLRGPAMGRWWPKEYGSPSHAAQREVLEQLSPVHAEPPWLPPVLLVTGEHDPTVTPSHSYKLAEAWKDVPGGPVLLRATPWPSHLHHLKGDEKRDAINARPEDAHEQTMAEAERFLERVLQIDLGS